MTGDGSHSIESAEYGVPYHSRYGARTESEHVFIEAGLKYWLEHTVDQNSPSILEYGIGTGLNALLSHHFAQSSDLRLSYTGIEKYPIDNWTQLNYLQGDLAGNQKFFNDFHNTTWQDDDQVFIELHDHLHFCKINGDFREVNIQRRYDVIFFDAFAPNAQEELWEESVLQQCYDRLHPLGVWVSYCAKGEVRRRLQRCGFQVERIPGPPGKREMLRATKQND